MIDRTGQTIIIHFQDGSIQKGLLQSHSLTGKTLRYIPQSLITDRRRAPRVPFVKEVTIDQLGVRRGVDLSAHGMYVETLIPYPVGTILPVSLRFGHETIELDARVIFNEPGIGMGLEFERLTSSVRHKLEAMTHSTLDSNDNYLPRDRRARQDRRGQKQNEGHKYRGREFRKNNRRQNPGLLPSPPVEVAFSRLKSVFFLDQGNPIPRNGFSHSLNKEVIVAFRDGEEIHGILTEISPEKTGFFVDLPTREKRAYTAYVIKTAVKRILYL
jgi:hypothetical protein